MDDHSQNDLNEFFKSKLTNVSPAANQWNVPPMEVFHESMAVVNKKKKRRLGFLLLAFAIFLMTSAGLFYANNTNNYIKSIESKVEELELALALTVDEKTNIKDLNFKDENLIKEIEKGKADDLSISNIDDFSTKVSSTPIIKTRIPNNSQFVLYQNTLSNEILSEDKFVETITAPSLPRTLASSSAALKRNIYSAVILAPISTLDTRLIWLSRDYVRLLNEVTTLEQETSKVGKWSALFFAKENNSCMTMNNLSSSANLSLKNYDNRYTGVGFEFRGNYKFDQFWSLNLIGGFDRYSNESNFFHRANYNLDQEHLNPDGSASYQTDVFVMTPLGSYSTVTNFAVEANQHSPDDWLNNETTIAHKLNVISTGLGINAQIPFVAASKINVGGGAMYNRIIRIKNEMETTMKMNEKEMIKMDSSPDKMVHASSGYLSLFGEIYFERNITSSFSLLFGAQYNRSVTSLRSLTGDLEPNTYLHNFGINLGGRINF